MKVNNMTFLTGYLEGSKELIMIGELHRNEDGYIIITLGEDKSRFFVHNEEVIEHNGLLNATKVLSKTLDREVTRERALIANQTLAKHKSSR